MLNFYELCKADSMIRFSITRFVRQKSSGNLRFLNITRSKVDQTLQFDGMLFEKKREQYFVRSYQNYVYIQSSNKQNVWSQTTKSQTLTFWPFLIYISWRGFSNPFATSGKGKGGKVYRILPRIKSLDAQTPIKSFYYDGYHKIKFQTGFF